MTQDNQFILDSIHRLDAWLSENNWKAYDPFDGLNTRASNLVTLNNHYLRIILQQGVRRFPLNLRPFLGIRKETSSKGMGFLALAYLKMYQATGSKDYSEKLKFCLQWLKEHPCRNFSGYSWGNHFSYESRGGRIPYDVPTIVWTSWIANAFLLAFEELKQPDYFEVAKGAADFIITDIGRYIESDESICFMYRPNNKNSGKAIACVHNANVLGAWLLARIYEHTGEEQYFSLAKKAINYTMKHQRPEGGWWYGEPRKFQWEDNFHTGYNLESIYGYIKATGDERHLDKLIKGFKYYMKTFFKDGGTPNYYNHKTYPLDIQCAAQGIQTLVNLSEYDSAALDLAERVAKWTINNMQSQKGYFYFRKYRTVTNRTPMFHWGQATMMSALAHLYNKLIIGGNLGFPGLKTIAAQEPSN